MSTGLGMWLIVIGFFVMWFGGDYLLWIMGYETATQFLIRHTKQHRWLAWAALAVIVLGAALLISHFELIERLAK